MKKSILALLFLLFTGIAFSQTTVTLQDQCDCEVLKGTDVSSPGATSPTGADLGDIYVNTNTGTIYFWDGNSWELTSSDNQQLTGFNFDDVTNILSLSLEDGGNVNVDLSSLKDIFTDSNTAVTSFDIDGTNTNLVITDSEANTFSVALADLAALIDTDNQNLSNVLVNGNNANGATITGLGTPTAASDAATKAYVDALDGTDDQDLGIGAGGTANESVELTITDGASATIDIRDGDFDPSNEIQNIEEVLSDGNNANGATITGLGTPTAASDAATKAYVDALDGTDDQDLGIGAGGTANESVELTITDGTSATIDIRDGDFDPSNEIQNIEEVLSDGNNANGATITGLGTPTAASDAATKAYVDALDGTDDQDLGIGAGGTANESVELTITDGTSATIDIRDGDFDPSNEIQDASEVSFSPTGNTSSTNVQAAIEELQIDVDGFAAVAGQTNTASNVGIAGVGTFARKTGADLEFKNINAGSNRITITNDAGNDEIDIDINDSALDATFATDAELSALDGTDDQDLGIGAGGTANESVELTITDGTSATIDIRDGDFDPSNEIQNIEEVLSDGNNANGATITGLGTPTAASDAATKAYVDALDGTDDQDLGIGAGGTANESVELTITDGTSATIDIRDGDFDPSNEIQNIEEVLSDGNNANGATITGLGTPTAASDAATKAYVDALDGTDDQDLGIGAGGTANESVELTITDGTSATIDIRDGDFDPSNEIQDASEVSFSPTGNTSSTNVQAAIEELQIDVDGFAAVAGQTNTASNVGIAGVGTFARKTGADLEFKNINAGSNRITITNDAGNDEIDIDINDSALDATFATDAELSALDGTDDQDLGIGAGGTANESVELTITDGTSATIDIRDGDFDPSNEIQNIEEVLSDGNNANGATITGLGTPTAASDAATKAYVDALDGTDDQDLGIGAGGTANESVELTITDGASATIDIRDGDFDPSNEIQNIEEVLSDGNNANGATITGLGTPTAASDAATKAYVDALDGTDDQDLGIGAGGTANESVELTITDGASATIDIRDGDFDPSNEIQNIEEVLSDGNNANGATITGLGTPTAASDAATKAYVDALDGTDDQDLGIGAGGTANESVELTITDGTSATIDIRDGDFDPSNEIQNIEEVLSDGNNANGATITGLGTPTAASDAATKAYVDALDGTDDQDLGIGAGGTANESVELTITDGTSATIDIRDGDFDPSNEIQDASEVSFSPTGNTSSTNVQAAIEELQIDVDGFAAVAGQTNTASNVGIAGVGTFARKTGADLEFKNINAGSNRITITNDAGNDEIDIDINDSALDATFATDAELSALDGTDDQDLGIGAGGTANESVELTITDGTSATIDIRDGDFDPSNEIQNIEEVLSDGNNANGATITGLGTPTAASDAATKAYVDALDGTDDQDLGIGAGGTANESVELTITDGTSATIDIRDGDFDPSNEIQDASEVSFSPTGNTSSTNVQAAIEELQIDVDGFAAVAGQTNTASNVGIAGVGTFARKTGADLEFKNINAGSNRITITNDAGNDEIDIDINDSALDATFATDAELSALDGTDDQDLGIGAGGTANESVELTITDGASATIDIRDGDFDPSNEIQNIEEVLSDGNNANGATITGLGTPTAASDAATKAYVDALDGTDDQDLGIGAGGTANESVELTITDGTSATIDIRDGDFDPSNEIQDASEVSFSPTGNTSSTNVQAAIEELQIDVDGFAAVAGQTNTASNVGIAGVGTFARKTGADLEFKNINAGSNRITITNDAGNDEIDIDINDSALDATFATDAELSALDGTDDQDLGIGAGGTANESVELTITDGTSATIDIRDGDFDPSNEIQNIEEVLSDGNNANGATITGLGTPTAASDAATKAYVDALDGTDDQDLGIGAGGTANESVELTITDGASATIDIRDGDFDPSNEIQNIEEVLSDGNNANGATITGLGTPTAASDAATKAYVDALDGTDDQDLGIGAGGTANESVELTITDGTSATIDIRDGDFDPSNEIQNIEEVLSDGNNANGATITGLGTPTAASDAATKAYVDALDGTDDQDLGIGAGGTANESVELTITDGASATIDIRDGDFDPSNEIQNIEEVLLDGNNANGATITGLGIPTAASDAATKAYVDALDGTDDQDLGIGAGGTANESVELTITDGTSATIDIRDGDFDPSNEIQNIEEVLLDGNNANGATITGLGTPTAASDAATKAYVDAQNASDISSNSPVDVDGDGNTEATVEDVIQDIAPITSKAARIFYPPSIAIDASSNGAGRTLNLYSQYVTQYGTPAVASAGAPAAIPTYGPTELYYYITYADPTVFDNMSIDANGQLTYDIIGQPADYNALINVVFVVK
ncbi:hypothetical protein LDL77_13495 [Flagellimonas marinaquae]|nr:hypothetical protein LDL77_13495 [Allomuricauda aquimarina]